MTGITFRPWLLQAALLGALAIIVCGPAKAAGAPQPCGLVRYASLPFTTLSDGRIAIPVKVDGHDASFLVDTGGVVATMSQQLADLTGHTPKETTRWLAGVAGNVMSTATDVNEFSIGKLKGSSLPVYIDTALSGIGVDGTLSPDMMAHFDVDFDFAHGLMNLFSQDHCPGKVVYWAKDWITLPMDVRVNSGHIRVPVTVDGKKIMAILDTGSTISVLSMHAAQALGVDPHSPDLKLLGSSGPINAYRQYSYPFKSLDMNGIAVTNPNITILSDAALKGMGDDMIIGISIMRQLHLYIAYKEEKLYITPAQ